MDFPINKKVLSCRKFIYWSVFRYHYISLITVNVHEVIEYFSVNKRLDEWVAESWLDTRKVQFPRRDGSTTGGTTTPKKTLIGSGGGIMPNFLSMCVSFLVF